MMKKSWIILLLMFAVALAPAAWAQDNSLSVTSAAALGGVADQICSGDGQPGPCGLELHFEPGSFFRARVQHTGFGKVTVYRARWLMDINNFDSPEFTRNFFFQTVGNYYHPTNPVPTRPIFRCTIQHGAGSEYGIGCEAWNNPLNRVGLDRCLIPADGPFEVQVEWTAGCNPTLGIFRLKTYEGGVETCTSQALVQNCIFDITYQQFETLPEASVLSTSIVYIDEFSSFRTLETP